MEIEVVLGFKSDEEFYTVNSTQNRVEIDMYEPEKKTSSIPHGIITVRYHFVCCG